MAPLFIGERMGILATASIVKLALGTINSGISLYKKKTPSWEQSQAKKLFSTQAYLEDLYEIEKRKPRYDDTKDEEFNKNARSEDRLLNIRDKCLLHGEEVIKKLGSL